MDKRIPRLIRPTDRSKDRVYPPVPGGLATNAPPFAPRLPSPQGPRLPRVRPLADRSQVADPEERQLSAGPVMDEETIDLECQYQPSSILQAGGYGLKDVRNFVLLAGGPAQIVDLMREVMTTVYIQVIDSAGVCRIFLDEFSPDVANALPHMKLSAAPSPFEMIIPPGRTRITLFAPTATGNCQVSICAMDREDRRVHL